jgi:hypothetical protein
MTREHTLLLQYVQNTGRDALNAGWIARAMLATMSITLIPVVVLCIALAATIHPAAVLMIVLPFGLIAALILVDQNKPLHALVHVSSGGFFLRSAGMEYTSAAEAVEALGARKVLELVEQGLGHDDPERWGRLTRGRARKSQKQARRARRQQRRLEGMVRSAQAGGQLSVQEQRGELSVQEQRGELSEEARPAALKAVG